MSTHIFWFRNDLRLADNPALAAACAASGELALVYVRSPEERRATAWGFPRWGALRQAFRDQALQGLEAAVRAKGGCLQTARGRPEQVLPEIARRIGARHVFCEAIAAPEETAEVAALRAAGLELHDHWQSSLLAPEDLPFPMDELPDVFTAFRQRVERAQIVPRPALVAPARFPPGPAACGLAPDAPEGAFGLQDGAWFPFDDPAFHGAESHGLGHLKRYFESEAPRAYKATRNGLSGIDYSTKLSAWMAVGAISARTVFEHLKAHEARFGANESTYWIWFELLWRDFFRFWSLKHGRRISRARGLGASPPAAHDPEAFSLWCQGRTGQAFVDAGLRQLAATGYLSNRMRQVVASYLVHDLRCDWRAGAAWFESQLIDYDVCSNQGNWLYIAGLGADPRHGRRFDPDRQARTYDPQGTYRAHWAASGGGRAA